MEKWPFVRKKLVVVHNGISAFKLALRRDELFTVGTIAELHKIKGLDILLEAWAKFVKSHEGRLIIIGEGEERNNLENMARNKGIFSSVSFRGFVDDARSFLSNFDIFCLPSRSENLPYALLEAGYASLPVVATSVGGVPELIESGISGVLVPNEDVDALFSSIVLLSEDSSLRRRLGAALKASIEENFSFEKMARETFAQYDSC